MELRMSRKEEICNQSKIQKKNKGHCLKLCENKDEQHE